MPLVSKTLEVGADATASVRSADAYWAACDEAGWVFSKAQKALATEMGVKLSDLQQRVSMLHELNPMLGHRGCRLAVTYPEILRMQVRAIVEAAITCRKKKV